MTIDELTKSVKSRRVHQIRSGTKHRFIDITVVAVDGRFFVRQYQFGTHSWHDAFLANPAGELKSGDIVVQIDGVVPEDLDEMNPKINRAFHKLLPVIYAAMKLTFDTKRHEASTIELIPKL